MLHAVKLIRTEELPSRSCCVSFSARLRARTDHLLPVA